MRNSLWNESNHSRTPNPLIAGKTWVSQLKESPNAACALARASVSNAAVDKVVCDAEPEANRHAETQIEK